MAGLTSGGTGIVLIGDEWTLMDLTGPGETPIGAWRELAAAVVPSTRRRFGGLHGVIRYDDAHFDEPDPDIQQMFYGDDG